MEQVYLVKYETKHDSYLHIHKSKESAEKRVIAIAASGFDRLDEQDEASKRMQNLLAQ